MGNHKKKNKKRSLTTQIIPKSLTFREKMELELNDKLSEKKRVNSNSIVEVNDNEQSITQKLIKNTKSILQKGKEKIEDLTNVVAYIFYYYDKQHLQYERKVLRRVIPSTITLNKTNESFLLTKPAMYEHNLPVFILERGIPYSRTLEFPENQEEEEILRVKGNRPAEIESLIKSHHTIRFLNQRAVQFKEYLIMILFALVVGLIVYAFCVNTIPQTIKYIQIPSNSTEDIVKSIGSFING